MTTHNLTLDLAKKEGIPPEVTVRVGEHGKQYIQATLTANGEKANIPENAKVLLQIQRHNGGLVRANATRVAADEYSAPIPSQAFVYHGVAKLAYFAVYDGDVDAETTQDFKLIVLPGTTDEEAVRYYDQELNNLLVDTETLNEDVEALKTLAGQTQKDAEEALEKANKAVSDANEATEASKAQTGLAEAATDAANDAAGKATAAAGEASSAAERANASADAADASKASADEAADAASKAAKEANDASTAAKATDAEIQAAEAERKANEELRKSAEEIRDENEQARQTAEEAREAASKKAVEDANAATQAANSAAEGATSAAGEASSAATQATEAASEATNAAQAANEAAKKATESAGLADAAAEAATGAASTAAESAGKADEAAQQANDAASAAQATNEEIQTEEAQRQANEKQRVSNEDGRVEAEAKRAEEHAQHNADQAQNNLDQDKNNADQAANNLAAQGRLTRILEEGEYDPDTRIPTIEGDLTHVFAVPNAETAAAAKTLREAQEAYRQVMADAGDAEAPSFAGEVDNAREALIAAAAAVEAANKYTEWLWLLDADGTGYWEMYGSGGTVILDPVTTEEIDSMWAGTSVETKHIVFSSGESYNVSKIKAAITEATDGKADKGEIPDLTPYAKQADVDEALALKAGKDEIPGIATTEAAGIVKPDGDTVSVADDGTISITAITDEEIEAMFA